MTFALLFEFLHTLILHLTSSLRVMMTALHKILMCLWRRVFFFNLGFLCCYIRCFWIALWETYLLLCLSSLVPFKSCKVAIGRKDVWFIIERKIISPPFPAPFKPTLLWLADFHQQKQLGSWDDHIRKSCSYWHHTESRAEKNLSETCLMPQNGLSPPSYIKIFHLIFSIFFCPFHKKSCITWVN